MTSANEAAPCLQSSEALVAAVVDVRAADPAVWTASQVYSALLRVPADYRAWVSALVGCSPSGRQPLEQLALHRVPWLAAARSTARTDAPERASSARSVRVRRRLPVCVHRCDLCDM